MTVAAPREYGHFIDGSWRESVSGARIDVVNPATGELLARVPAGNSSDVDAAVVAAGKAFGKWGRSSPGERQKVLLEIAARIERRAKDFALLETRNVGKPIRESQSIDVPAAVDHFRYFAAVVSKSQTTARWISLPDMPTARGGMAAVVFKDQIFVLGGENEEEVLDVVEVFSTETRQWSTLPSMPWAATDLQGAVIGDRIYLPGGRLESGDLSSTLSIFDPATGSWSQGTKLPFSLCCYAIAVYNNQLYLFGGWDGQQYLDSVLEYDPQADHWNTKSPLDEARMDAAAVLIDDEIQLVGGFNNSGALDLYQVYSPALEDSGQNPWKDSGPLPDRRYSLAAAAIMKMTLIKFID